MNDATLISANKWLIELGVRTEVKQTCIWVNRDDIINLGFLPTPEGSAYDTFLKEIRDGVNSKRLYWGGKDDSWMYLSCF